MPPANQTPSPNKADKAKEALKPVQAKSQKYEATKHKLQEVNPLMECYNG